VFAPLALITASRGTRLINPSCFNSVNAWPNAEQLPRFPPGTITQSGGCQSRASSTRYMIDFCPSRRNGFTLFHQVDPIFGTSTAICECVAAVVEVSLNLEREARRNPAPARAFQN